MKKTYVMLLIGIFIFTSVFIFNGCSRKDKVVKFGAIFPLTGEVASYGKKAKNGIELRINEQNKAGGLLGKQVVVDFQDDKNDKKEAVTIFQKFASIDHYPVVFGSAGSTVSLAVSPLAEKYKTLLISPISSSALLSTQGGDYFFRTCPSDNIQAEILANWVIQDGMKDVVIIYTNNSWGKPLAENMKILFERNGIKVHDIEGVNENTVDFKTIIAKLNNLDKLDAIISPTYPKEGGALVKQLKENGINVILYGGDNWGAPEFVQIAGNSAEGVFFTAPSEKENSEYNEFVKKYNSLYNEDPDIFAAYAYDAATAVINATKQAKSFDPDKIREKVLNNKFQGVSGIIDFKENGDINSDAFSKKQIVNGKPKIIE